MYYTLHLMQRACCPHFRANSCISYPSKSHKYELVQCSLCRNILLWLQSCLYRRRLNGWPCADSQNLSAKWLQHSPVGWKIRTKREQKIIRSTAFIHIRHTEAQNMPSNSQCQQFPIHFPPYFSSGIRLRLNSSVHSERRMESGAS